MNKRREENPEVPKLPKTVEKQLNQEDSFNETEKW